MIKSFTSIYLFTDYRKYLLELYEEGKRRVRRFSYRMFADMLGFSSAGTLNLIIEGQRNFTPKAAKAIADALMFSERQRTYLNLLVAYERAKSVAEKNSIFSDISALRMHTAATRIESNQYKYLSSWYNVVIRELVKGKPADSIDYEKLGGRLIPAITPAQARKSIELLVELGFLSIDENGNYAVSTQFLETPLEIRDLAVRQFHHDMISLADKSIEQTESSKREISSLTLFLSSDLCGKIKARLREVQDEIIAMVTEEQNADQVYQLNFQFFPVAKSDSGENGSEDYQ